MQLEFRRILAGLTSRARKPKNQGIIDRFKGAIRTYPAPLPASTHQSQQRRLPRLRQPPGKRHNGVARARATNSHNRNGGWRAAR
jgi:hypothetical protein